MKKLIIILAILASANSANAGFETKSEAIAEKRARDAAKKQREELESQHIEKTAEEASKTTALISEQNAKIDTLIEETKKNNALMRELLDRLQ